jgi:murein DD-endopeptidase MepM/ murein hydrolase activator NlpD
MVQDLYPIIWGFFLSPVTAILAWVEPVLWSWLEWLLSTWLGGVHFQPPPRPETWPGAPPGGEIPPGPGPGTGELIWPCTTRRISGYTFENPPGHHGIDIGTPTGETIWSIKGGTIAAIGREALGYGNRVDIEHPGGWWSRYAHLQYIYVNVGQQVGQGQTIATADNTGNSTGPHLHFELKLNGAYVNPIGNLD